MVANGGRALLLGNDILGAHGDGIAMWKDPSMDVFANAICGNTGVGIAMHAGASDARICGNHVTGNETGSLLLATALARGVQISGNVFDDFHVTGNETGSLLLATALARGVQISGNVFDDVHVTGNGGRRLQMDGRAAARTRIDHD